MTPSGIEPCEQLSANLYDIYHCCLLNWKTPDDGQRNCPKYVEFHCKNKFEKLVHLVGFYRKKFITMHGHMNVKLCGCVCLKLQNAYGCGHVYSWPFHTFLSVVMVIPKANSSDAT